jgi:hypothetical protein
MSEYSRIKTFNGTLPAHALELDEDGIPAIAYWNQENDHPVKAETSPNINGITVYYKLDKDLK